MTTISTLAFALASLFARSGTTTAVEVPPASPGFSEAIFTTGSFKDILRDSNCDSVRFYNVMHNSDPGSLMAIGVNRAGFDLNKGLFVKPYVLFAPTSANGTNTTGISRSDARQACAKMQESGSASFSATIAKRDLDALLALEGAGGVLVTPQEMGDGNTFLLTAVRIEAGRATPLGSGGEYERVAGVPCPHACGEPKSRYINEALLPK